MTVLGIEADLLFMLAGIASYTVATAWSWWNGGYGL